MGKFINYPGGVVVHFADGTQEHLLYGAEVDLDLVADYQRETLAPYLDEIERTDEVTKHEEDVEAREQTKSSGVQFGAVPGDYDTLDESEAQGVVRAYRGKPAKQAEVVAYESLHQNRLAVKDEGSEKARELADELLGQVKGQTPETPPPAVSTPAAPAPAESGETPPPSGDKPEDE